MDTAKSPEGQIKEAIWKYSGWTTLIALTFLGGVAIGYVLWGDAIPLRSQVIELTQKVSGVRTERENLLAQVGRLQRENEALSRENQQLKAAAAVH